MTIKIEINHQVLKREPVIKFGINVSELTAQAWNVTSSCYLRGTDCNPIAMPKEAVIGLFRHMTSICEIEEGSGFPAGTTREQIVALTPLMIDEFLSIQKMARETYLKMEADKEEANAVNRRN